MPSHSQPILSRVKRLLERKLRVELHPVDAAVGQSFGEIDEVHEEALGGQHFSIHGVHQRAICRFGKGRKFFFSCRR